MKTFIVICVVALLFLVSAFALRSNTTSIAGRVNPIDGATSVFATSGKDSANASIVSGNFVLAVKPGIYRVLVDATPPYKDAVLDNISVKEDQTVDLGEIVLQK